jgi:hypothetical protein
MYAQHPGVLAMTVLSRPCGRACGGDTIGGAARPRDSRWSSATQLAAALIAIVRESDLFVVDLEIPLTGLLDEVRALRSLSLCATNGSASCGRRGSLEDPHGSQSSSAADVPPGSVLTRRHER